MKSDVVVAVSKIVSGYFHCLQIVSLTEKLKQFRHHFSCNLVVPLHSFSPIDCWIIRSRIVIGAAIPIGSKIEEAARSRFRCVCFFWASLFSLSVVKLSVSLLTLHRIPRIRLKILGSLISSMVMDLSFSGIICRIL